MVVSTYGLASILCKELLAKSNGNQHKSHTDLAIEILLLTMAVSVPHTKLGEFDVRIDGKAKVLGFNPHTGYMAIRRYDAVCQAGIVFEVPILYRLRRLKQKSLRMLLRVGSKGYFQI